MNARVKSVLCSERGVALVVTLLITAILVAVITEVVYAVHIHVSRVSSYKDTMRASVLAEGGVELASRTISEIYKNADHTVLKEEDSVRIIPAGEGVVTLKIEDEQSKFPVNLIIYPNGETNPKYYSSYARLVRILGLKQDFVDTLADWIDIDDEPRPYGAETYDYYSRRSSASASKGAPLDSVQESLLVKGYTPDVFSKLYPFLTVYSNSRVNINTAPKEVIMALSDEITDDMAQRMIEYRGREPFRETSEIRKVRGFETIGFGIQDLITVKSGIYKISSRGEIGDGQRYVEAVVDVQPGRKVLFWRER